MLSREDIKTTPDITTEKVPCPEWGKKDQPVAEKFLLVRGLTAEERDNYEKSLIDQKKKKGTVNLSNMRAKLVAISVVDDSGLLMFSEQDIEWLGKKSAAPIDRIFGVAQKLSGMSDEDVEALAKNLESIQPDASA